jgi:uncharacterized protein (DUF1015 family)
MSAANLENSANQSRHAGNLVKSSCTYNSLVRIGEYRRVIHETMASNELLKTIALRKYAEIKKHKESLISSERCANVCNVYTNQASVTRGSIEKLRGDTLLIARANNDCLTRIENLNEILEIQKQKFNNYMRHLERLNKMNVYLKAKLRQRQKQLLQHVEDLLLSPTGFFLLKLLCFYFLILFF